MRTTDAVRLKRLCITGWHHPGLLHHTQHVANSPVFGYLTVGHGQNVP